MGFLAAWQVTGITYYLAPTYCRYRKETEILFCLKMFVYILIVSRKYRDLDKRAYLIYFSYFSSKPYVVTPHLNRLVETVQMRGHNICFYAELTKVIPNYHQILLLSRALKYILGKKLDQKQV